MAMTDMTEEELRRFAEALANASVSLDKKTAEERAAADKSKAVNDKAFEAVSATASAFVTLGKEAYKGASASQGAAAATEKMGEAALAASVALIALAPGGPLIKGVLTGLALLGKKLFELSAESDRQTGEIYKAYQEIAKAGASGARGMQEVFDGLQKVGLGTEKFAAYTKLISDNAGDLATFGSTLNKGTKTFENTMASLSNGQREQLEYMGLDREAQAAATMNYIKQQRLLTLGTKEQMNTSGTAVMKYIEETDKLTRITGLNRQEQEKMLDEAMHNEAFNATMQDIFEKQGEAGVKRVKEAQAMAAMAGPATKKQFEAALSGFIGSSQEAQEAFMSSGGEMFELTQRLRDGQVKSTRDTAESMNKVFKATGEVAKQMKVQAQMMNFGKGGMGNYFEATKAATLSINDLAQAEVEADLETKKRDAQTQKMAKAENDQRRAQLAIQAKLQLGMDMSITKIATAAENLRLAGEYALAWAKALRDGNKSGPNPGRIGPTASTLPESKAREESQNDLELKQREREEARKRQDQLNKEREELEKKQIELEKQKGKAAEEELEAVKKEQQEKAAEIKKNDDAVKKARLAENAARRAAEQARMDEITAARKRAQQAPGGVPRAEPGQRPNVPGVTAPPPPGSEAPAAPAAAAPAAAAPAAAAPAAAPAKPAAAAPAKPAAAAPAATAPAKPPGGSTLPNTAVGAGLPGYSQPSEAAAMQLAKIRELIGKAESFGGNYNAVVGEGNKNFGLTNMTLEEIDQFQRNRLKEGKGTPVGKYQMHINTLGPTAEKLGISRNQKFDELTQDKLADFLIRRRGGYDQYALNPSSEGKERLLNSLSTIWAGLPRGPDDLSYYHKDGKNKAHISWTKALESFGDGGIVNKPTFAQIGEKGPEAVIPLKSGAVPVHINSKDIDSLGGGYNELKGYNTGPMTTDLAILEKIAGKLGAYDKSTQMITDPKLWKEIVQSGMLMNYNLGTAKVGTRGMSEMVGSDTVADALAGRIKELIDTKKDSGEAVAQTRTEFADMMKTFYEDFFAKMTAELQKENSLDVEMLATLKEISRTNSVAAGSSEKMLRYAQN